ncbi:glycoside hydrolase superfamily [Irpex rosettiformis]|uniref:Glycoside hydrolase superfamily n=1 Tax=Irpex rosettiformis TaxID=378272 RepID=A0ACB8U0M7_9APHY|nr:glycoside hydrolase superfamily [Irpex rosettiformis]
MRISVLLASCVTLTLPAVAQQIYDIYSTTWDQSTLFTYQNLGSNPINFGTPGSTGAADIVVNDGQIYQTMFGHGASLTDSAAQLLSNLKSSNSNNYWSLLGRLFDPTDGNNGAGLSYLRVPLGASDFSSNTYSFDDTSGDTSLNNFNIDRAPSYLFSIIKDIYGMNPYLKVHILPWSPPGWMKDSGTMNGGNFLDQYSTPYANYLLKALQGFQNKGIPIYAIGIQNEPENSNPTYPTCKISASQEAQIGNTLRSLMNNNGFSNVKLIGYEHNWNDAGGYPVQVIQQANSAFAGVSFHCYSGSVGQQDTFHNAFPSKEVYFTECSGSQGSDWWSDIKWYMDNLYVGSVEHWSSAVLMWNLALDGSGDPELPGSNSCDNPRCRGVVTISGSSYTFNQECTLFYFHSESKRLSHFFFSAVYAMAQASKAIVPKDKNGPWGQRIGVTVNGGTNWALRVGAYVTHRNSASDWNRYSLVVMNWNDNTNGNWNPQTVKATIEFRGMQATYTFPVGVTTLWWYAVPTSSFKRETGFVELDETDDPVIAFTNNATHIPQYTQEANWGEPSSSTVH